MNHQNEQGGPKPPKQMVPVLPPWLDWNSYTIHQKILSIACLRAVFAAISFVICICYACTEEDVDSAVLSSLILLCIVSSLHFMISIYFVTFNLKVDNARRIKYWLWLDTGITAIFVVLLIVFTCLLLHHRLYMILNLKLAIISIFMCFRSTRYYVLYLDDIVRQPLPSENVPAANSASNVYMNVYN